MKKYTQMTLTELEEEKSRLKQQYDAYLLNDLKLDMSRGKPCAEQLNLSAELLSNLSAEDNFNSENGADVRNYGGMDGIPEIKRLFADIMEVKPENVIVGGTASLQLMFDYITQCLISDKRGEGWLSSGKPVKFLCPCPGYDRHFSILEYYGVEMIPVNMYDDGPDTEQIKEFVKDEAVKGMFCVPKYSNPTGCTYSDEKVKEIAALKPAAKDFKIIWDNAYIVHDLVSDDKADKLLNIFPELKKNGNEDMLIEVCSTSKITFAGAGVSALAASDKNISEIKRRMSVQLISNDKINQLRHAKMLPDLTALKKHMDKHRAILAPKFEAVDKAFTEGFEGTGIAEWTKPCGGYFISLELMEGTAKRTVELCKNAGVVLTPAGAPFPYGKDPRDSNIRVAPSYPPIEELKLSAEILIVSAKIAAVEKLLAE